MNPTIRKIFSAFLIILFISFSHVGSADTKSSTSDDTTAQVICNIIGYVWGIGGPLMTVVIIGAALLAIFGRMPWPALFALGVFCAVFFGAKTIVTKLMSGIGGNTSLMNQCGVDTKK
ncbi:TrbC/VirB2 family protein [Candidatus Wolbachia massiliensis]|uniref:TrbC/VirB2 family protein n=1 Tax=Candidatus Wolbachia massiliensis TaxID=1845000 RepID=A0A7L7YQM3_9RICK|nr:TrbC/VirB2 family protein [Candidatus Wolbachia massiliensis]QOD38385.1 TrbC/VirB2 family protein [Candidatus Wolbachia massiliensis]